MSLHTDRGLIVDRIYNDVELPKELTIVGTDGWEHIEGGFERHPVSWTKVLYVENVSDPDGDSVRSLLSVSFYPNSTQVESITLDGEELKVPETL